MSMEIYGTLGPACSDAAMLERMFHNGMTGVRLNLSHVTLKDAMPQVGAVQEAAKRCGLVPKLLIDMQGPELRAGRMADTGLETGETVLLGNGGIPLPESTLPYLLPGQDVLLDDGKILLTVTENRVDCARAEVKRGGILKAKKSVALPGTALRPPTMTADDLANISMAVNCGVTGVMQPFVRDRHDLGEVRAALDRAGGQDIELFAKIENSDGVAHLDELIPCCDEIVIARGDLGNAVPLWELPAVQKQISEKCRKARRRFTVVTQMLTSMEKSPVPTRAEVSDIFNAVLDGASSVMVTGETAVGQYPAEVIKYLTNTINAAERYRGN